MIQKRMTHTLLLFLLVLIGRGFSFQVSTAMAKEFSTRTRPDKDHGGTGHSDLKRKAEVICLQGQKIPSLCGIAGKNLSVVIYKNHQIQPVPFQIDERNEANELVLPYGLKAGKDQEPAFDKNDLLLFMANDLGDQIPLETITALGSPVEEIQVIDPIDRSRAWAYVVHNHGHVPRNKTDYVRYTVDHGKIDRIDAQHYSIHYPWGQYSPDTVFVPPSSGGTGVDFLDRFKARGSFKFFFSLINIRLTENRMGSRVTAYIDGPIRVIRRVAYWANLGFGLRSPSFEADITYYPSFIQSPTTLRVPVRLDLFLSKACTYIGNEYTQQAYGMIFKNANDPDGTMIDGRMSPQEKSMNLSVPRWTLLTGPQGTVFRGFVPVDKGSDRIHQSLGYIDDYKQKDPPEDEPGQVGYIHDRTDITHLQTGVHRLEFRFYFLPHYQSGDEEQYLKREGIPLQTTVIARAR